MGRRDGVIKLTSDVIKIEDLYDFIFCLDFIEQKIQLQLGNKDLKQPSLGERGTILLFFRLFLD